MMFELNVCYCIKVGHILGHGSMVPLPQQMRRTGYLPDLDSVTICRFCQSWAHNCFVSNFWQCKLWAYKISKIFWQFGNGIQILYTNLDSKKTGLNMGSTSWYYTMRPRQLVTTTTETENLCTNIWQFLLLLLLLPVPQKKTPPQNSD